MMENASRFPLRQSELAEIFSTQGLQVQTLNPAHPAPLRVIAVPYKPKSIAEANLPRQRQSARIAAGQAGKLCSWDAPTAKLRCIRMDFADRS